MGLLNAFSSQANHVSAGPSDKKYDFSPSYLFNSVSLHLSKTNHLEFAD